MSLLDSNLTTQLAGLLTKMVNPINLVAYVDSSKNSQKVIELLNEVADQSSKITVIEGDKSRVNRKPSFAVLNPQTNVSVSFAGLPLGWAAIN
jgi:NADH-dependent peroxiredoxin subunit F